MATLLAILAPSCSTPSLDQALGWAKRNLAARMYCSSVSMDQCQVVFSWAAWSRAASTEVAPSAGYPPPSIVASRSGGPSASALALSRSHLPHSTVASMRGSHRLVSAPDSSMGQLEPAVACFEQPGEATAAVEGPGRCPCSFDFPTVAWGQP